MESLLNLLMYALPGGFLGSVFTWLVGRREHNNDMLSKLQASINMLSEENRKILAENVQLRRENAHLQANQEVILQKQHALLEEVERLRTEIINLTRKNNETFYQRGNPHADGSRSNGAHRLHDDKTYGSDRITGSQSAIIHRTPRFSGESPDEKRDSDRLHTDGSSDDPVRHLGGDTSGVSDPGCPDPDPP